MKCVTSEQTASTLGNCPVRLWAVSYQCTREANGRWRHQPASSFTLSTNLHLCLFGARAPVQRRVAYENSRERFQKRLNSKMLKVAKDSKLFIFYSTVKIGWRALTIYIIQLSFQLKKNGSQRLKDLHCLVWTHTHTNTHTHMLSHTQTGRPPTGVKLRQNVVMLCLRLHLNI